MFKIKFNKNWWVTGAFCALAMNINTALGITEAEFNEKHDRLVKELIPMRGNFELSVRTAEFVAKRAGFSTAKGDEAYSICYLLYLGYSPKVILRLIKEKKVSPITVISALSGHYEDLDFDMHEILDSFAVCSEEWELDLSSGPKEQCNFVSWGYSVKFVFSYVSLNMEFIAGLVRGNTSLTVLSLVDNDIGDHAIAQIFEASKSNPNSSLKKIDLSGNSIGDYGAMVIAEILKTDLPLEELVLVGCGIGDKGITALSEALKVNEHVVSLDVRDNRISDIGKKALADALKKTSL